MSDDGRYKIRCFHKNCAYRSNSYMDLSQHIIENKSTHTDQGMIRWAMRYSAGLRRPPERKEPTVTKTFNGMCPRCHKPFEKPGATNLSEICQC